MWLRKLGLLVLLGTLLGSCALAQTPARTPVEVQFVSVSGVSLPALSSGEPGEGFLLYYLLNRGPERPSLVVHLTTRAADKVARAEVYQAPPELTYVPLTGRGRNLRVATGPILSLEARGGWWVREGRVNYNLDVQVDGPVYAMWGGGYTPEEGFTRWTARVAPGEPAVRIRVRDPNEDGVPDWDWRSLLPKFIGNGYLRTNYAERKCESPLQQHRGLSPLWPFVAAKGHFEQPVGHLYPPIVMNWQQGKIVYFSEIVTARNQNCSYTIYSQFPLKPGRLNRLNFEHPFAFYDLSGEGQGHPNLILRTERFPAGDPYFVKNRLNPRDLMAVRYSWRHGVGDWRWDYKVEVLGFHPYEEETPIAGGEITVDAPSYEAFPAWVTERRWPVTTFVHVEDANYRSSEGIYDWSTRSLGDAYLLGWQEAPNPGVFDNTRQGFRSEYRYRRTLQPKLYLSPVDNRLHLLGAEGGVWNLGNSLYLVTENLSGGLYLDTWRLEEKRLAPEGDEVIRTLGELFNLEGFLLLAASDGFTLQRHSLPDSLLELLPPSDRASWRAFEARLTPYRAAEKDPSDLQSWLSGSAPSLAVRGARMSDLRRTPEGFRFVLSVQEGAAVEGALALPALRGLTPGRFVVAYNRRTDAWTREAASHAYLKAALKVRAQVQTFAPTQFTLELRNEGSLDWRGPVTLRLGGTVLDHWEGLLVPARGGVTNTVNWTFDEAGRFEAALQLGGNTVPLAPLEVVPAERVKGLQALLLPTGEGLFPVLTLLGVLSIIFVSFGYVWRRV